MVAGGVGLAPFATLAEALAARGTPTTLFYGARPRRRSVLRRALRATRRRRSCSTTEDGSRGDAAASRRRSKRALRARPAGLGRRRIYACGPTPMMRAVARARRRRTASRATCRSSRSWAAAWAAATAASCRVAARRRRAALRALVPRRPGLRRRARRLGRARCGALTMARPLGVASASLHAAQPAHRRQRLLRLRRRVRRRRRPRRRSAASRSRACSSTEREGHPPPRIVETPAGMLNAIGLQGIGVHRFVAEKLPELRAPARDVIVNICGTTLDEYVEVARILSDAEGVAAHRAEHLVPEHQGRRHPVRLQPDRHARRRQRRAQGDAAAGDSRS